MFISWDILILVILGLQNMPSEKQKSQFSPGFYDGGFSGVIPNTISDKLLGVYWFMQKSNYSLKRAPKSLKNSTIHGCSINFGCSNVFERLKMGAPISLSPQNWFRCSNLSNQIFFKNSLLLYNKKLHIYLLLLHKGAPKIIWVLFLL